MKINDSPLLNSGNIQSVNSMVNFEKFKKLNGVLMKLLILLTVLVSTQAMAGNPDTVFDCKATQIANNPWNASYFNLVNKSTVKLIRDDYHSVILIGDLKFDNDDVYEIMINQGELGANSFNVEARSNTLGNYSVRVSFTPGGKGFLYYHLNQGREKLISELNCKAIKIYKN